jgi:hypothetical protein
MDEDGPRFIIESRAGCKEILFCSGGDSDSQRLTNQAIIFWPAQIECYGAHRFLMRELAEGSGVCAEVKNSRAFIADQPGMEDFFAVLFGTLE